MDKFAWPAVALIFGIFFVMIFRKQIASFLSRVEKVSKSGVDAPQAQALIETRVDMKGTENFLRGPNSVALQARETALTSWLNEQGLIDHQDIVKTLVRHLVASYQETYFQRIVGAIWGSQLEILLHLNTFYEAVPVESLRPFYDTAAQAWPDSIRDYSFEHFLGYLGETSLIGLGDETARITDEGRDFLIFLVRTGNTARRSL